MKKILLIVLSAGIIMPLAAQKKKKSSQTKKDTTITEVEAIYSSPMIESKSVEGIKDVGIVAPPMEELQDVKIGVYRADNRMGMTGSAPSVNGEIAAVYNSNKDKNVSILYIGGESYYNRRYGLYDYAMKKQYTPFIFTSCDGFNSNNNYAKARVNNKYGLIGTTGQIIVPFLYDEFSDFELDGQTFFIAKKNDRCGIIDLYNNVILPFDYSDVSRLSYSSANILIVSQNGKKGLLNFPTQKMILPCEYDDLSYVSELSCLRAMKGKYYSFIAFDGTPVFKKWYERLYVENENLVYAKYDGKYGIIDRQEKVIIPFEYVEMERSSSRNDQINLYIVKKNDKSGVIKSDGSVFIPIVYDEIYKNYSSEGYIVTQNGKKGIINSEGKITLPINYDNIESLKNNYFLASQGTKFGIVTLDGKNILPVKYNRLSPISMENSFSEKNLFLAELNNKAGIVDMTGKPVVDFTFDNIVVKSRNSYGSGTVYLDQNFIAIKNGKYGMMNMEGSVLIPFEYDDLQYLNSFTVIASKNNLYGIREIYSNRNVLPFEYTFISADKNKVVAYKNGFKEYILSANKIITSNIDL